MPTTGVRADGRPFRTGVRAKRCFEAATIRYTQNGCPAPKVPIIAVTASTSGNDCQQCLEAGMNDYLPKPVNPQKLVEKIQHWHQRHRIGVSLDAQYFN